MGMIAMRQGLEGGEQMFFGGVRMESNPCRS